MDWAAAERARRTERRIAKLIAVLGAVLALMAAWFAIEKTLELRRGLTARGTVVDHVLVGKGRRQHLVPRVQFRDRAGIAHVVTTWDAGNYDRGEIVAILYNPSDPADASLHSTYEDWKAPVAIGSIASLFLLLSIHRLRSGR